MNIGRPQRTIDVEPTTLPIPELIPVPGPAPGEPEPVLVPVEVPAGGREGREG